jgi:hypothetical protein
MQELINETFRFFLLRFNEKEINKMIEHNKEFDKAWIPYTYCFIADTTDKRTLLDIFKSW